MVDPETPLRLGSVLVPGRLFLAPMAAYTSWPFRRICRRFGAALVTTEVVKAREVIRGIEATRGLLRFRDDEHPIAAQILSADPGEAAEATRILLQMGFDLVDLNCGCPKRRIVSDGLGGGLMASPERIGEIVAAMARVAEGRVTVKLRAGLDRGNVTAIEAARRAEDAGAVAICIHPRFARGASSLQPDWSLIAAVRSAVRVPTVGNGGIRRPEDAVRLFEMTGCDAIALGQAAIGRPWIFRDIATLIHSGRQPTAPTHEEILSLLLEHYDGLTDHHGELRGTVMMRKQSCHYAKRLRNGRDFNRAVARARSRAEFLEAANRWLGAAASPAPTGQFEQHPEG